MASGNVLAKFFPTDAELPVSNPAGPDVRNNQPHLAFDGGSTDESVVFTDIMPPHYSGGGVHVDIDWRAATAITGGPRWKGEFERQDEAGLDTDSDSFAAAIEANGTAPGTAGQLRRTRLSFTNSEIDGLLAGERFRFRLTREASDTTNDTMAGDAEVVSVLMREQ
jgi:hypothetical protein